MNVFANDILVIFQIRYCLVSIEGSTIRLLQKANVVAICIYAPQMELLLPIRKMYSNAFLP